MSKRFNPLPDRLKRARARLGWTQERLARLLRVTTRSIVGWETGAHVPRRRQDAKIKRFLRTVDGLVRAAREREER